MGNKRQSKELLAVLGRVARNPLELDEFLRDLLTPAEYQELAIRWQIVRLLAEGVPQRTIAKRLKIGIATVSRGSRALLSKSGGFAKALKKGG